MGTVMAGKHGADSGHRVPGDEPRGPTDRPTYEVFDQVPHHLDPLVHVGDGTPGSGRITRA